MLRTEKIRNNRAKTIINPTEVEPGISYWEDDEVEQWQKALDENKEQRNKDFREAYQATLCKCGYDKIKCKVKEVKCE